MNCFHIRRLMTGASSSLQVWTRHALIREAQRTPSGYRCAIACLFLIVLVGGSSVLRSQDTIARSVLGSGAALVNSASHSMHATVGQTVIGRMISPTNRQNLGFWYTIQTRLDADRFSALVVLPNSHAAPGDTVRIPLLLQQSKSLLQSGARTFRATIRFNATLLEPLDHSIYTRVNDTGWVRVSGSVSDSAQVLAQVDFIAKLGNNESTDMTIENFQFTETAVVRTVSKHGVFSLDGVCRENGEIRLIKIVQPTSLQMYPNPASVHAELRAYLTERGETQIKLIDERGITVAVFFDEAALPGALAKAVDFALIPSGSYYLIMRTPNEMFSQKLIIQK